MSTSPACSHGFRDPNSYYSFGPFHLNLQCRVLTKAGVRVRITAKALEVLLVLVERSGETLTKAQLRAAVWGTATVDENNLNQCISAIRKALGERAGQHEYILTVTGIGYRFIAPVTFTAEESAPALCAPVAPPPVRPSYRPQLVFMGVAALVFVAVASILVSSTWVAPRAAPSRGHLDLQRPLLLTRNRQAFDSYLEGRRVVRDRRAPELTRAIRDFQVSVANDPNFALAYAWLAEAYAIEVANGAASPDMLQLGEAAAAKALALNPALADAHSALGLLKYSRWDWNGARYELATALRLDPNNSRALMRSAMVSFVLGRFSEAESRLRDAQAFDPSNGSIAGMLGELDYYQRHYDAAIKQADRIMRFDSANLAFAWDLKTRALIQEGHFSEARSAAQKDAALSPQNVGSQLAFAWLKADRNPARFAPVFHRIMEARSNAYTSPYILAAWYARQSDKEEAFGQLEIAYRQRVTDLVSIRWDPSFDSLRGDPRYSALLGRMGLSNRATQ